MTDYEFDFGSGTDGKNPVQQNPAPTEREKREDFTGEGKSLKKHGKGRKILYQILVIAASFVLGTMACYFSFDPELRSLSKLKKYPLIMMDKNTVARHALDAFMGRMGVELTAASEVGSWDLMKRLVEKGMGIGVIPREYATAKLEEGTLFEVRTDPVLPVRSVGMLLPKNKPVSYALHSFIEYFRKEN